MRRSDTRDEPDLDDWFDEPDTSGAWAERSARSARSRQTGNDAPNRIDAGRVDAASSTPSTRERPPIRETLRRRRVPAAVASILVVCLLGGLAAAGVFSGGDTRQAQATTPSVTAPTATAATQRTRTAPAPAAPAGPLKPGDRGAAVAALQRALARLGYAAGAVDGQYGPATTQAVSSFQRAHGLTADGVLGPKSLAALTRALESA
jgi:hypothetical protein